MTIGKKAIYLTVEMPTDGGREITKNNKTVSIGGGRKMTNPCLSSWYDEAELLNLQYGFALEALIKLMDCKLYDVKIYWSLKSYQTDAHNFNEMLMDWLEKLTGVNDRNFLPSIIGKEKNGEATVAYVVVERHAEITLKEFENSCEIACK